MKKEFRIEPLVGISDVKLEAARKAVIDLLGPPEDTYKAEEQLSDYFWESELKICYSIDSTVEYIEVSGLGSTSSTFNLFGINVFETKAEELVQLIIHKSGKNYSKTDEEIPYSFIFPDLELSLWREYIPEDIEESDIESIGKDGYYFDTIGIGTKGYYSNMF
jgi:hypothetical protein